MWGLRRRDSYSYTQINNIHCLFKYANGQNKTRRVYEICQALDLEPIHVVDNLNQTLSKVYHY